MYVCTYLFIYFVGIQQDASTREAVLPRKEKITVGMDGKKKKKKKKSNMNEGMHLRD